MNSPCDILIIGGGINGAGIAADAAGRGLSVTLCEMADPASGTSSCSTKLIHGGLRYLEQYAFRLVRSSLAESQILAQKAPHLIAPLKFILPHSQRLRPAWMIRAGLFFYDHLADRPSLPRSGYLKIKQNARMNPLRDSFDRGYFYYDFFADDARLVIENLMSAAENHADILTRTRFIAAKRRNTIWEVTLKNENTGIEFIRHAKALVNAAGPWVKNVSRLIDGMQITFEVSLVRGTHLIVPRLYEGETAYIMQTEDKRVIFAIPWREAFTLIGTTDFIVDQPGQTVPDAGETAYLLECINRWFAKPVQASDIIHTYAGIRCLQNESSDGKPAAITRDYKILSEDSNGHAPLLTIIGGKLTNFRALAESALDRLRPYLPAMEPPWTADTPLPGGRIRGTFGNFVQHAQARYHFLPPDLVLRYAKTYGAKIDKLLENIDSQQALGDHYGAGLYQREVEYLIQHEWAKTAADILWRRTKLGLSMTAAEKDRLQNTLSRDH